ncbi:MAG: DUF1559 domain-containing protein [Planctomycetaceae bacterium]|jgi:prepilin-type processing-associated H-X9-DG protein
MLRSSSRLWLCGLFGLLCVACGLPVAAQEKKAEVKKAVGRPAPQAVIPLQKLVPAQKAQAEDAGQAYELSNQQSPVNCQVVKVMATGELELKAASLQQDHGPVPQPGLIEGWYLGLAVSEPQRGIQGSRVVRVKVTEILEDGGARVEVGPGAAAQLKAGEALMLFRPVKTTTARLRLLPDIAPLDEAAARGGTVAAESKLIQSKNNLKQIALAMHNYHDTYGQFPPAVVNGPDGKPWHSWRVLILPFLEGNEVYNQYRFDEPWDGPNNRKLLSQMPKVYSDPIHGENNEFHTHYVVPTGDDVMFLGEGVEMADKNDRSAFGKGLGMRTVTDGTSNTILVVPATPEEKIPWMKPEDFEVGVTIADVGKKDSIPTPYAMGSGKGAPVAFADGSVRTLTDAVTGEVLLALLTRAGGEVIDNAAFAAAGEQPEAGPPTPVIRVFKQGAETRAVLELRR